MSFDSKWDRKSKYQLIEQAISRIRGVHVGQIKYDRGSMHFVYSIFRILHIAYYMIQAIEEVEESESELSEPKSPMSGEKALPIGIATFGNNPTFEA